MLAHTSPIEHAVLVAAGVIAVSCYGWAWLRSPPTSRASWRLWSWAAGVSVLAVSTSPPLERIAQESFTGHMVQHLLMIVIAAPLIVVARPVRTIRGGIAGARPTASERAVARWWRSWGPVLAPAAFVGVLYVTHLTTIYDDALRNRVVHDAEHVAYFATALALWAIVRSAGRASAPARVGAVFAVIAGSALLGVVLLTVSAPLIDTYAESLGPSDALDDQRAAASLMWVGGMALTLPLLITAVWRWAAAEQRAAERAERLETLAPASSRDVRELSG